jgi:hypothetical protein
MLMSFIFSCRNKKSAQHLEIAKEVGYGVEEGRA